LPDLRGFLQLGGRERVLAGGPLVLQLLRAFTEIVDLLLGERALVADDFRVDAVTLKINGGGAVQVLAASPNGKRRAALPPGGIDIAEAGPRALGLLGAGPCGGENEQDETEGRAETGDRRGTHAESFHAVLLLT
jgi:hypothetical protein